jgi:TM2 domain-containing membrane protein YozV
VAPLPPVYQYQPIVYATPPVIYVKRKEPGVALLLSFLLPGLGQIYNGDVGKGIAFMLGFFVLIWIGIGIAFWIWSMIDAYQSATNINMGRRI